MKGNQLEGTLIQDRLLPRSEGTSSGFVRTPAALKSKEGGSGSHVVGIRMTWVEPAARTSHPICCWPDPTLPGESRSVYIQDLTHEFKECWSRTFILLSRYLRVDWGWGCDPHGLV